MDDISTRTVIIAVNIFVTITIVTLVVAMFSRMGEIYGAVAKTDTAITSRFDDIYSMYHGRVESGIGLLNAIKKYQSNENMDVVIMYPEATEIRKYIEDYNQVKTDENKITEATYLKVMMEKGNGTSKYPDKYKNIQIIGTYRYEDKYNVTVEENENGKIVINYIKVKK